MSAISQIFLGPPTYGPTGHSTPITQRKMARGEMAPLPSYLALYPLRLLASSLAAMLNVATDL